ncbi:MAG TPA: TonB-dependent receptor, partial [Puia sp.]|nr:TonB-dependent receptor [Puia sp.]
SWGAKIDGSQAMNPFGATYAYSPVKDNWKNFYKTGLTNQTSVGLIGSNDKGHFRLGVQNMYLQSNIPNSDMKQQGLNFNSTYNITPKLQMGLTANYIYELVDNRASFSDAPGNIIYTNNTLPSTYDVRWLKPRVDSNRNELLPGNQDIYYENPYFVAYDFQNQTTRNRLTGGLTLKYNILDWLYVQAQVMRDGYTFTNRGVTPNGVLYSNAGGGNISMSYTDQRELDGNAMIGVTKKIKEDFGINADIGAYSQDNVWKQYQAGGGPFIIPFFYSINNVGSRPMNYYYSHSRVNSVFGNLDLSYKNFLFLNFTGRNDWFSVLNPKTNSYFYPSVSGSFVFTDAFRLPAVINFGKLRASWGGSSNTGEAAPYSNALTYGLQGYQTNGQPVGFINGTNIPNQFLKPVQIKEYELGLNMEFFDSRLGFDVAGYSKTTTDDIVQVTVPQTSGYTTNTINIGQMRNSGIEILLTGTPVRTKDFSWNISWNFAYNKNKVLSLGGPTSLVFDQPRNGTATVQAVVGLPYDQIVGYKYKRDANNRIVYDTAGLPLRTDDVEPMGSGTYDKTGGITNEFHYKNLSFSFLIDYKFGAKIYSGTNLVLESDGLSKKTLPGRDGAGYVGDGVTEDGKVNTKAVITQDYFGQIAGGADNIDEEFLYDASFIKLRSIVLSYNFPKTIIGNGFVKGLSLSFVARNVATLMKHTPNVDPESNYTATRSQGLELAGYPQVRSFGFNLNVKF